MNTNEVFERVVCINLTRRADRWGEFLQRIYETDWPFRIPDRIEAIDGEQCGAPRWWQQGKGAWGCYRSHLNIIENCLNEEVESVLIFEDDAEFVDNFGDKTREFFRHLSDGWSTNSMIYLGGQHLYAKHYPPIKINDHVYQPFNVNRTHAYSLSGRMIRTVYNHLIQTHSWRPGHHIDHHLGRLHQQRRDPVYAPREWLVLQGQGKSDISGKEITSVRNWEGAEQLAPRS